MRPRSVVFNGDLGSGKTTVSTLLSRRLGVRRISVGDIYREMAAQRGLTALQMNLHAELDDKIDHYVDRLQSDIAASGEQLVVDSRLAWHFFTNAVKVHLITDPVVAAERVLARPADGVESYTSVEQACEHLERRSESERSRFLTRYGVDKTRLRNYDVVCDTTRAAPEDIVDRIEEVLARPESETVCYLDPERVRPGDGAQRDGPLVVEYARPHFRVLEGADVVDSAVAGGATLVRAALNEAN